MASIPTDHLFSQQTSRPQRKAAANGPTPFADVLKPRQPAAAPASPTAATSSGGKTQQDQAAQQQHAGARTPSEPHPSAGPPVDAKNSPRHDPPQSKQATSGQIQDPSAEDPSGRIQDPSVEDPSAEDPSAEGTEPLAEATLPVNENTSTHDAEVKAAAADDERGRTETGEHTRVVELELGQPAVVPVEVEGTETGDPASEAESTEAKTEKGLPNNGDEASEWTVSGVQKAPESTPVDGDNRSAVPSTSTPVAETVTAVAAAEPEDQRRPAAGAFPNKSDQAPAITKNDQAATIPQSGSEFVSGKTLQADVIVDAAAAVDTESTQSVVAIPTDGVDKGSSTKGRAKAAKVKSSGRLARGHSSPAGAHERASGSAAKSPTEAPKLDVSDLTDSRSPAADSIAAARTAPLATATRTTTQVTFTMDDGAAAAGDEDVQSPTIAPDSGPRGRSPQQVYADSATATQRGTGPPAVDPRQLVQRVTRAFQTAHERGGPIRLRLSPPELGSLRLEVELKGDTLTARIEAETVQAKESLMQNLSVLRERLIEHGIRIERFDVDLMQHSGQSPDQPNDRPSDESVALQRKSSVTIDETPVGEEPRQWQRPGDGGLNVVV